MRFNIPKNRTAPLILFAFFSVIVTLILGISHMNLMEQYSYRTKLETIDSNSENIVGLIRQEVENNYKTVEMYAEMIANAGDMSEETISDLLHMLSRDKVFNSMAVVDSYGKGYNLYGDEISIGNETYFKLAKDGRTNVSPQISYTPENVPIITYASPITNNGENIGVLITSTISKVESTSPLQDDRNFIYVINDKKELILYASETDRLNFDYDLLTQSGILINNMEEVLTDIETNNNHIKNSLKSSEYIWNLVPLGINNWSVLVGTQNTGSTAHSEILLVTKIMWCLVILGTVLLCTLMIIFQRRANRKLIETLYLDPVTGGNNWYKFRIQVNKMLNSRQFMKKKFAIINFDINRFKIINDAYGYQKGDEVLKDIYTIIKKWAKPGEPFTRYAADQFYILMSFHEENEVSQRINELNDRLHQLRYTTSTKIFYGIYFITERQDSIDRMGEFAGIAKNNIKGNTEGIMSFFDDEARDRLLEEEKIEKSMNEALKNDEFQVYLQPKYKAKDETISGAEALVRWFNSDGRNISPSFFIPVFEKNGFITELDYYMIRKVCEVIRGWLDKGFTPLPISVNVSRLHFANPHLAEIIKDIVDNYQVPYNLIELELTESAFLQNKQALIRTVTQLRKYGFLVSMDDFGAGYSSLNSLKDLPLDVVKLDGELFRMTSEVERGLTVVRNTIMMAKDLHMKVVAECIETREQVEFLCKVGCDIIQGYYFAKPMSVSQFEERYFTFINID